ncbi:MAG: hypothetical protein A2Z37_13875 [Chloroflexi bacterium RBG_19FT_COMBO_62_14]|nr:MAG: hypothetical protein A2Z37_13875 [Chloroflexi bacterium RBG_19FT_COMBO_62_14]
MDQPRIHLRTMLMAGAPFREAIFPYGPFVMNTQEEIQQALTDLRNGTFVQSEAESVTSSQNNARLPGGSPEPLACPTAWE